MRVKVSPTAESNGILRAAGKLMMPMQGCLFLLTKTGVIGGIQLMDYVYPDHPNFTNDNIWSFNTKTDVTANPRVC